MVGGWGVGGWVCGGGDCLLLRQRHHACPATTATLLPADTILYCRLYRPSDRSVLMGANIAGDIARGELSECSIAYNVLDHAKLLQVGGGGGGGCV